MPFFLVTHTSLVEAENEEAAAGKAVAVIRGGGQMTVTVKSDEATTRQVVVEGITAEFVLPPKGISDDKQASPLGAQNAETKERPAPSDNLSKKKGSFGGLSVFLVPFLAGSLLTGVIARLVH